MSAYLKIRNTVTAIDGDPSVLYDQNANQQVEVWLEDAGVEVLLADGDPIEAGKYTNAAWQIYGPDGPEIVLAGVGSEHRTFTPPVPGRWLVRLTAQKYVTNAAAEVVLSDTVETFTALYEVQDPNILGHRDARAYGNGAITRGSSIIAPNETNEYDSDEGWSRGIERYLQTVSREQGFRSTAVVKNTGGAQIDAGYVCCADAPFNLERWKNADVGTEDFNNVIQKVTLATATSPHLFENPKFVALENIAAGDRGLVLVEGIIPFDTTAFANGDVLYISDTGELTNTAPSTVDAAFSDYRVGVAGDGGLGDGSDPATLNPGSIYFHGYATLLPGFIQGPLSSTDNAIATWNGADGDKLNSSDLSVYTVPGAVGIIRIEPLEDRPFSIQSRPNETNHLYINSGSNLDLGPSGNTQIRTGTSRDFATGNLELNTGSSATRSAGNIEIQPGASELLGANVTINGGTSSTDMGGEVVITGGTAQAIGQTPGGVQIKGGYNFPDDVYNAYCIITDFENIEIDPSGELRIHSPTTVWKAENAVGSLKQRFVINTSFASNSSFEMRAAGAVTGSLNTDDPSFLRLGLSLGTDVVPAAGDLLLVDGSGTFTDLTVTNKLNVGGLIDPTGMIFTPISDLTEITDAMAAGEGGIFVAGAGLAGHTEGDVYFITSAGTTTSLTEVAELGESLAGPMVADSTTVNQAAIWTNTDGNSLGGAGVTIDASGSISSIVNGTGIPNDLTMKPAQPTQPDAGGANLTLESGSPDGVGMAGTLGLSAADARIGGGSVHIDAGDTTGADTHGGKVRMRAGHGWLDPTSAMAFGGAIEAVAGNAGFVGGEVRLFGGKSLHNTGEPGNSIGGQVFIEGGSGGRNGMSSGGVTIDGGLGSKGSAGVGYRGGSGGDVTIMAGSAGLDSGHQGGSVTINAGDGDVLSAAWAGLAGSAGIPGSIKIAAGNSPNTVVGSSHLLNGANVEIRAGNAGINSGADGGNIVMEPGAHDQNHPLPAIAHHGIIHMCGEHDAFGDQKSYVAIGSAVVSGLGVAIGDCFGRKAHTVHGNLKVTGLFDPIGILVDPQALNPAQSFIQDAWDDWNARDIESERTALASYKNIVEVKLETATVQLVNARAALSGASDDEVIGHKDEIKRLERLIESLTSTRSSISTEYDLLDTPPIDPSSVEAADVASNTLWFDSNNGNALTIGTEPVGTVGTVVYDHQQVVFNSDTANAGGYLADGDTGSVDYYNVSDRVAVVMVDCTGGDVAIQLPDPVQNNGRSITVKDKLGKSNVSSTTGGQIHIVPPQGHKLDQYTHPNDETAGGPGPYPVQTRAAVECYSDGSDWFII